MNTYAYARVSSYDQNLARHYRDCKILVSMQNTSSLTRRAEKILKG